MTWGWHAGRQVNPAFLAQQLCSRQSQSTVLGPDLQSRHRFSTQGDQDGQAALKPRLIPGRREGFPANVRYPSEQQLDEGSRSLGWPHGAAPFAEDDPEVKLSGRNSNIQVCISSGRC